MNFLDTRDDGTRPRISVGMFAIVAMGASLMALFLSVRPVYGVVLGLVVLGALFLSRIWLGIYVMSMVAFFHGWEIDFASYAWSRQISWLAQINAPIADFVGLFFLGIVVMALVFGLWRLSWRGVARLLPHGVWYGLFLLVAVVSAFGAYDHRVGESLSYVFRPMMLVYILYAVLPLVMLQRRHRLATVTRVLAWLAGAIAIFGLIGLVKQIGHADVIRVVPFGVFGVWPFGDNHNVIAEVLVALLPFPIYLALISKDALMARVYGGMSVLVGSACLLTLSRAAWFAVVVQALVCAVWYRARFVAGVRQMWGRYAVLVILVTVLLGTYFTIFLGSSVVTSSNMARVTTAEIALFSMRHAPVVGYGPGMFLSLFEDTYVYVLEFGEPLDAHGILLKLGVETGLVGVVAMGMCLYVIYSSLFREVARTRDPQLAVLVCAAVGALCFQLFNTSYFNAHLWFPIGLALAGYQLSRHGELYAAV